MAGPAGAFPWARPARSGETLLIFATGLGPVTNPPSTGAAALTDPISATVEPVIALVGGEPMTVVLAGLVPAFSGLYQVNVELSEQAPSGSAVPLVIQVAGVDSNTTLIAVEDPDASPTAEVEP